MYGHLQTVKHNTAIHRFDRHTEAIISRGETIVRRLSFCMMIGFKITFGSTGHMLYTAYTDCLFGEGDVLVLC